jgi:4-hydroxy-tetrahydrodipicolinate reductase
MKIALLGYGKMGKIIDRIAVTKGHEIVCRITRDQNNWEQIDQADVCIDFSHPHAVLEHLHQCAQRGKSLVIGTTGWDTQLEHVKAIVERSGIGVLFSPNFSLGVFLFLKILDYSAELIDFFSEYDVGGIELHHAQKKDAPSGTALEICRRLKSAIKRIEHPNMTAVRLGSIPGKHLVMFDSPYDTISLCHEARNREGFARGAVEAAEWLHDKKGFYTLDDFFKGVCCGS